MRYVMTSTPAKPSDLSKTIREKASVGALPSSAETNVWTDEAQTPPARVTSVANKAKPPAARPPPIHAASLAAPGRVRM